MSGGGAARAAPAAAPSQATTGGVTFGRVVASEWVRLRSLRSTLWLLVLTVVAMVGVSVLIGWAATAEGPSERPTGTAASLVTAGVSVGQLAVAVLGVLAITGEYASGTIRSTMVAVPGRLPVLWARCSVLAAVVAATSVVAVVLAHLTTRPFQQQVTVSLQLSDPDSLRILVGAPLFLATIAVLALAAGCLVRSTAGALASVLGILLVVENLFAVIPVAFLQHVGAFLPATAGGRLLLEPETLTALGEASTAPQLTPWQGYAVMLAWTVTLLAAAAVVLRRRDV